MLSAPTAASVMSAFIEARLESGFSAPGHFRNVGTALEAAIRIKACRNGRVQSRFRRLGSGRIAVRLAQSVRPLKAAALRIRRGCRVQCRQGALRRWLEQEPQEASPQAQDAGLPRTVGQQLGARDTGMYGDAAYTPTCRFAASLKLEGEHQASELGLTIDRHRLVPVFCLQIVEVDGRVPRDDAGKVTARGLRPFRSSGRRWAVSAK